MGFSALFMSCFDFLAGYGDDVTQLNNDLGVFLLAWSIFSLLMTIASHRTTAVLIFLFFMVHLTFLMLSIGKFLQGNFHLQQAGGAFGLIAAFTAWYAAFAGLLTSKNSLFQLPVGDMDPIYRSWGWLAPLKEEKVYGKL